MIWTEAKYKRLLVVLGDAGLLNWRSSQRQVKCVLTEAGGTWRRHEESENSGLVAGYPITPHEAACIIERAARVWLECEGVQVYLDDIVIDCGGVETKTRQYVAYISDWDGDKSIATSTDYATAQAEAMLAILEEGRAGDHIGDANKKGGRA